MPARTMFRTAVRRKSCGMAASNGTDCRRGPPRNASDRPQHLTVRGTTLACTLSNSHRGALFVTYRSEYSLRGDPMATEPLSPDSMQTRPPSDELAQVLDETRARFVASFVTDCDAIAGLLEEAVLDTTGDPATDLTSRLHRLIGLPGTIGFPTVSRRALELEGLLGAGVIDAPLARVALEKMRRAFTHDLADAPAMAAPQRAPTTGIKILIAEDHADERNILGVSLLTAGFLPIALRSGEGVVAMARAERPALILLDIAMPGLDGYSVCRLLKADPELSAIPVILMTTGANAHDQLAGLMLGAEDFLSKPIDMRELILRIRLRIAA